MTATELVKSAIAAAIGAKKCMVLIVGVPVFYNIYTPLTSKPERSDVR